ncbi:EAL domain-containing protein [Leucothrix arctica]|uniref:GGDEF domain-containing protein n=1 Tax=Leucothrix arctica TaxID=1481894 RepID=A0A317CBN1_9GAMM|nr:EAL domain-containing protein [Leucothrix arctica]PWQ95531.1 GGDEF domain-containing protein [Leucothrix arctica]
MFKLNSLSLRSRFLIAPAIGLILTLVIFFKSYVLINDHSELLTDLHNTELPKLAEATRAMVLLSQHNSHLHDLLIHSEVDENPQELFKEGQRFLLEYEELELYFSLWTHDSSYYISEYAPKSDIDYLLGKIKNLLGLYKREVIAAIDFSVSFSNHNHKHDAEEENQYLQRADTIMRDLNDIFLTLSKLHTLKLKQRSRTFTAAKSNQTMTTLISLLLMSLMLLSALFFSRHLSKAIEMINKSIISLAKGDTDIELPDVKSQDLTQIVGALTTFQGVLIKKDEQQQELASAVTELTLSQDRYFNLLNISATAIITVDQNLDVVLFNLAAEKIYGFKCNEMIGQSVAMLIPKADRVNYKRKLKVFSKTKGGYSLFEEEVIRNAIRKNGEVFPVEMRLGKTKAGDNMLMTMSITDVTDRVKSEQEIRHQAHYDSLTGLPNRLLSLNRLTEYMSVAKQKGAMVGVMFLDLDDFKKINDSMGHEAGDLLLVEAAKRLRGMIDHIGTVGRLGGDEFIVLLRELESVEKAKVLAKELVLCFRDPFTVDGRKIVLTSSIGLSFYPEDATTSSGVLRNADAAMYHSKKLGRNTYSLFTPDMGEGVSRRLLLEEQMRGGLGRDEFSLNYQPKIDLRNNRVTGVEALVRWENEELGKVSPDEFISVAEHSGLIVELGQFVIFEALRSMKAWADSGFEISVAINLSPRQFHDLNLIPFIKNTIQTFKVDPTLIELEITEGVLMSGHRFITDALQSLNEMGIKLAMDDFGTGFSSLSYLRKYSFDTLKIDRSFIADLMEDEEDRALVDAIISMAHSLGLDVVAEGVETIDQVDYLTLQGCEYAQGFLKGRPMTFNALTKSLEGERRLLAEPSVA